MSNDPSDVYVFPEPSLEYWSGVAPVPPRFGPSDPEMIAISETLYAGLLDPDVWPRAVEMLAKAFNARGAQFCVGSFQQRAIFAHWLHISGLTTSADVVAWEDAVSEDDPAVPLCVAFPGHAITAARSFKPEAIELRNRAMNIPPTVGDMMAISWPHSPCWTTVGVWRDSSDPPFSVADQERLASVAFDFLAIGRCLSMSLRAPPSPKLDAAGAMTLSSAAGLVQADGRALKWNDPARSWAQSDAARDFLVSTEWTRACRLAARGGEALARSADGAFAVRLARLNAPEPAGAGSVVNAYSEVMLLAEVLDPGAAAAQRQVGWQDSFGLTEAEIRVLQLVKAGSTIDDMARRLDVTRETVRSHLRALRRKTGRKSLSALAAFAAGWD